MVKMKQTMADESGNRRTDSASRAIKASPQIIYRAFLNPDSLVSWLPPEGMSGRIDLFDPREGGAYKITLMYGREGLKFAKSSANSDVIQGEFLDLVPARRIVQSVKFASGDPAFSGEMIQRWLLERISGGTRVTIICENVPEGIRKEDHDAGLRSTLENLAAFTE